MWDKLEIRNWIFDSQSSEVSGDKANWLIKGEKIFEKRK